LDLEIGLPVFLSWLRNLEHRFGCFHAHYKVQKGISKTIISFLKAQNLIRSEKPKSKLEAD
jgi:hypothetical protein